MQNMCLIRIDRESMCVIVGVTLIIMQKMCYMRIERMRVCVLVDVALTNYNAKMFHMDTSA